MLLSIILFLQLFVVPFNLHKFIVTADDQCTTNADCSKFNKGNDVHVCIRWDGGSSYVCYLQTEAYCSSDEACVNQGKEIKTDLQFCYVPPWVTSSNASSQCFTAHDVGGVCLNDNHCSGDLVCVDNVCTKGGTGTSSKLPVNTTTKKIPLVTSSGNSTIDLEDYNWEEEQNRPIEIIGLPLWGFILTLTIPVILIIAICWGLSVGRRSYIQEEENKKAKVALRKQKEEMTANKSASNLNSKTSSQINVKVANGSTDELLKNFIAATNPSVIGATSTSSNSTLTNNTGGVTGLTPAHLANSTSNLGNISSGGSSTTSPNQARAKKSTASATVKAATGATKKVVAKPKKPKMNGGASKASSEYSESNSHRGLLSGGQTTATSSNYGGYLNPGVAESGVYSNYFASNPTAAAAAASTISAGYFGSNPVPPMTNPAAPGADPVMTNYYYQQMLMAQAQLQAYQTQAQYGAAAASMGMPMDMNAMMAYQQQYGAYGNGQLSTSSSMESMKDQLRQQKIHTSASNSNLKKKSGGKKKSNE